MPRFFKRSAKVPITIDQQQNDSDKPETCAIDTYRIRSDDQPLCIGNQNRSIENELNAEQQTGSTTSVSERVSNFVNGIFGIMGKNRRKSKLNQQPIQQPTQQQIQQQSHLKKVILQNNDKQPASTQQQQQQQQHGKYHQRQSSNKKNHHHHHNEVNANEIAENNHKSNTVPFDVNIKSDRTVNNGSSHNEKRQRKFLHDSKNNIKTVPNVASSIEPPPSLPPPSSDTFIASKSSQEHIISANRSGSAASHQTKCATTNTIDANARDDQTNAMRNATQSVDAGASIIQVGSSNDNRINKNSSFAEATATSLHSYIEIDRSISGEIKPFETTECKQSTPKNNYHISSSATDANNNRNNKNHKNEVNSRCASVDDIDANVSVNGKTSNRIQLVNVRNENRTLEQSAEFFNEHAVHTRNEKPEPKPKPKSFTTRQPIQKEQLLYDLDTMGQYQSTNTPDKLSANLNKTNNTKSTSNESIETKPTDQTPNIWHDAESTTTETAAAAAASAPAQAPHYDKNKIKFSNEINEILETETSSKQRSCEEGDEVAAGAAIEAANEIKDVFYETSSNFNDEITATEQFSDGESVTTPQYTGTVTENVNGGNVSHVRFQLNSAEKIEHNKESQKNDQIYVKTAFDCDSTVAASDTVVDDATTTTVPLFVSSQNNGAQPSVSDDDQLSTNFTGTCGKTETKSESECDTKTVNPSQINQQSSREQSAQMETNVLYRVDSCASDDALDLSDIEETVIDAQGKVVEVKTVFRQRSTTRTPPNDIKFRKSADSTIDGIRTIASRRRSNSISGSLGIEIVEVANNNNSISSNNNHNDDVEYLTQQPFVSFADDIRAIKLGDLHDNTKGTEITANNAIDIIEIVDEFSHSGSEYEEIEEEECEEVDDVEEEVEEEEETEEEEEDEEDDDEEEEELADSVIQNKNNANRNAFNPNANGMFVDNAPPHSKQSQTQSPHNQQSNYLSTDNDVIRVLINGQPARFSANSINLSNTNPEAQNHSHSHAQSKSLSHHDKSPKIINATNDKFNSSSCSNSKPYERFSEAMHQKHSPKYSDDAMHLPDIVVGSTPLGSNVNNTNINRTPPPKIVVNDNTLDSWSSNEDIEEDDDDDETGTFGDSYDEVDEETSQLTEDDAKEKCPNDKLLSPNLLNASNNNKNEPNDCQNNVHAEAKQHEQKLLAQISEAQTKIDEYQSKITELTYKISDLERDLTIKSWNIERLQGELEAAYKELTCVKNKLRLQESELDAIRLKCSDKEDDYNIRYNNLEADHLDLKQKLDQMQSLAISLQVQLSSAQSDLSDLRAEKEKLISERDIERQALQDALDAAIIERAENDAKWQRDFEQLRTLNSDREELLLQDCEWKIRETEKACKDRIKAAEQLKREAIKKSDKIVSESQTQLEKIKHLKVCEAELAALRGLTNEQRESITILTNQLEEMKEKLDESASQLEEATTRIHKMAAKFASDLSDKDREMIARIDEVRCEVASMWEDRLLNEMLRLKIELETCFAEDRHDAVEKAHREHIDDVNELKEKYAFREKMLQDELESIKQKLADRNRRLDEANEKADKQIMQIRMILNKSEQGHQREFHTQSLQHEEEIDRMKREFVEKETELCTQFEAKIEEIKRKCADDLTSHRNEMKAKLKKEYESQYEKFKADKEEEQQDLSRNYKRQLANAEVKLRDVEILHQREIKDLQNAHSMERSSLEQRDLQNSQEIETLHRKCRCLTQLFDEMRIRYERREPRAEDIREIQELKSVIEAQDKDLRLLTEKLREIQMHRNGIVACDQMDFEEPDMMAQPVRQPRKMKKPARSCDIIYEAENEEEEESHQPISV